jgi:hypothetical protein
VEVCLQTTNSFDIAGRQTGSKDIYTALVGNLLLFICSTILVVVVVDDDVADDDDDDDDDDTCDAGLLSLSFNLDSQNRNYNK